MQQQELNSNRVAISVYVSACKMCDYITKRLTVSSLSQSTYVIPQNMLKRIVCMVILGTVSLETMHV